VLAALCALALLSGMAFAAPIAERYDVVVAGGGMGGCGAALQAARMGASVLVVEPTYVLGGQSISGGVSTMDDLSTIKSGVYLEFVKRLTYHYAALGKSIGTCYWSPHTVAFEPFVGQKILSEMLAECSPAPVVAYHSEVIAVAKDGPRVKGVTLKTPDGERRVSCAMLIDATEYGDVLPLAGAAYRSGNFVSTDGIGESMIQDITWTAVIRKYPDGVPEHLRPRMPLPGYEQARANYEGYVTKDGYDFQGVYPVKMPVNFVTHNGYRGLPDSFLPGDYDGAQENWAKISKTSVNWGNDYPGTYRWTNGQFGLPASYLEDRAVRAQVERDALIKTLHFIYYMQNELGEPWSVDEREYGELPAAAADLPDEWKAIARHLPPAPYVRECRRAVGDFTLTAYDLHDSSLSWRSGLGNRDLSDSIAVGGYIIDLHHSATNADLEKEWGEQEASVKRLEPCGPFQVPLRALIPSGIEGLLAAEKNLSMTRLASGALRLQPICMMTGQAAGALAALSLKTGLNARDVPAVLVQRALLEGNARLSVCQFNDVPAWHKYHDGVTLAVLHGLMEARAYPQLPASPLGSIDDPATLHAIAEGRDKGRFGVNEQLTVREAARVAANLAKALGRPAAPISPALTETPVTRDEFAALLASALDTDDGPAPTAEGQLTRGEAAELVVRAFERAVLKK
jgi:hypothetical protein